MKSLLLSLDFPPRFGGIQTLLFENVKRLGGEHTVLTSYVPGCEEFDKRQKFRIVRRKMGFMTKNIMSLINRTDNFMRFYLEFWHLAERLIKTEGIDVVQCGHISTALVGYEAKRRYGIPYVLYIYGQEIFLTGLKNKISNKNLIKILNNAEMIYTISNFTKELISPLIYDKKKLKVVNIVGADVKKFRPSEKSAKLLRRFGLENKRVLLTVSRLEAYKGIDFVILSLNKVLRKIPNATYLVVGDGEDKRRLESMVKRLDMEKNVIFAGSVSEEELADFYNLCDVFILNSRNCLKKNDFCPVGGRVEGFGMVFLEANACGKPVIGGNSGGVQDAVVDGETGILVNPTDTNKIAGAVIRLLKDKKYANKLGRSGRKRVIKYYNYDFAARQIEKDLEVLR